MNTLAVPQRRYSASTFLDLPGLAARAAREDKRARFTALLHHVTVDLLRKSFYYYNAAWRFGGHSDGDEPRFRRREPRSWRLDT